MSGLHLYAGLYGSLEIFLKIPLTCQLKTFFRNLIWLCQNLYIPAEAFRYSKLFKIWDRSVSRRLSDLQSIVTTVSLSKSNSQRFFQGLTQVVCFAVFRLYIGYQVVLSTVSIYFTSVKKAVSYTIKNLFKWLRTDGQIYRKYMFPPFSSKSLLTQTEHSAHLEFRGNWCKHKLVILTGAISIFLSPKSIKRFK